MNSEHQGKLALGEVNVDWNCGERLYREQRFLEDG